MAWDSDYEEVLRYAEGAGLSDSELAAFTDEVRAAANLSPQERRTAIIIALAKYPQTRAMVRRPASDPSTETLRGEWLSREELG